MTDAPRLFTVPDPGDWPEPAPLRDLPDLPPLPGPVGEWAAAAAVALQVPDAFTQLVAAGVVSAATRGRWVVDVAPGWVESLALYCMPVLGSGHRKSACLTAATAPVRAWEADARDRATVDRAYQVAAHDVAGKRLERVKAAAAKAAPGDGDADADLRDALTAWLDSTPDPLPQVIAGDVTPEAAAELIGTHGAISVLVAEGGLIGTLAGRYAAGRVNLDVFLSAWTGEPLRVNRRGADPILCDHPFAALVIAAQPAVLRELRGDSEMVGRGLFSRFLFTIPAPTLGSRHLDSDPIPDTVQARWAGTVTRILDTPTPGDGTPHRRLTLHPHAARDLRDLRAQVEAELRPLGRLAGEGLAAWGSKLPGQVVRVAALVTLAADPAASVVEPHAMRAAITWADPLAAHARYAYHAADSGAGAVLRHLAAAHHDPDPDPGSLPVTTTRDVWMGVRGQAWAVDVDTVRGALQRLTAAGWVRPVPRDPDAGPGRPSERWCTHPNLSALHTAYTAADRG